MQPAKALLPQGGFDAERLLAPQEAIAAFFARFSRPHLAVETVALEDSWNRILARDVVADADYPNAPRSSMDGFAIAANGTPGTFRIGGDVRMGHGEAARVQTGTAARIPTGGVVPPGADTVVPIEDVRVDGESIHVDAPVAAGECVVQSGSDMRAGEPLLSAGRRVGAAEAGVLATLGITEVAVYRRPVFGVVSTGDELVPPDVSPPPGRIRDSNRFAVGAALRAMGANVSFAPGIVPDVPGALQAAIAALLKDCDGVVVTGGSSVGERDLTPDAVRALGEPGVIVHGLRVKPGKPTVLGAVGEKPVIGLPGNPASALTIAQTVAAPIVAALTGASSWLPATVAATLDEAVESRSGWTWYVPVALKDGGNGRLAHPLALRSSSVSLTARADGYVVMGPAEDAWPAGTPVAVHRFL
ncbi:MAG: molybdopterin molybdotransferase MoeA [Vulcanimicrobiaceae bacterium]